MPRYTKLLSDKTPLTIDQHTLIEQSSNCFVSNPVAYKFLWIIATLHNYYVTDGPEKSQLPCMHTRARSRARHTFHHQMMAVHIN